MKTLEVKLYVDGKCTMWRSIQGDKVEEEAIRELINEMLPGPTETLQKLQATSKPASLAYPEEITPELEHVLSWPNFKCGPYAQMFRTAGYKIPAKAESEQAFVLNWLVKIVLKHGNGWVAVAQKELQELVEKPTAGSVKNEGQTIK